MFISRISYSLGLLLSVITITMVGCSNSGTPALDGPTDVITVYKARCINCHGTELQGKIGPKTNLQHVGAKLTAEDIIARIEQGGDTMPPFKDQLSAEEIRGLAEWLAEKK